jgi:hypothetical protein
MSGRQKICVTNQRHYLNIIYFTTRQRCHSVNKVWQYARLPHYTFQDLALRIIRWDLMRLRRFFSNIFPPSSEASRSKKHRTSNSEWDQLHPLQLHDANTQQLFRFVFCLLEDLISVLTTFHEVKAN